MNLGGIKATIGRNKAVLGVAAAAVVAALAWRSRSAKASTSAAPDASTGLASYASTGLASYGAGYQTSAATGYDSTASDVYNAIQPQVEQTQEMLRTLRELWENPTPPTPVPADPVEPPIIADPPVPVAPDSEGFFRRSGTAAVYEALSNNTLRWLDSAAYAARQRPAFTNLAANDPVWSRTITGTDAPEWSKKGMTAP